ncbi:MAG TPA: hypothetical protein V6D33_05940 [Cyanophyceae cyanobacterium]
MHPRFKFVNIAVTTLLFSLSFFQVPDVVRRSPWVAQAQDLMATLPDGTYQVCSEPEAKDLPFGSGVCFWFHKANNRVVGNYGYPNSDIFICVSGEIEGNTTQGEALAVSWPSETWEKIPESSFQWDEEGHLTLNNGSIIDTVYSDLGRTDWIEFRSAKLELNGFYQYRESAVDGNSIPKACSVEGVKNASQ